MVSYPLVTEQQILYPQHLPFCTVLLRQKDKWNIPPTQKVVSFVTEKVLVQVQYVDKGQNKLKRVLMPIWMDYNKMTILQVNIS